MLRHWKKVLSGLMLIFTVWIAFQLAPISTPIVVSRETTYLTEPLAEDGLPDYSGALLAELREGVTPENNGGIQYLQAMWPAGLEPEDQQVICDELGMAVPETNGMVSPEASDELRVSVAATLLPQAEPDAPWESQEQADQRAERLITQLSHQPWTADDAPLVAEHIEQHSAEYGLLHEGLAKPKFYIPSPSLLVAPDETWIAMLLPTVQNSRDATRCLAARANLRTGEGDLEGAWSDLRAMYALSARLKSTTLVEELVSIAIEGVANRLIVHLLNHPELSRELAQQILDDLSTWPQRDGMLHAIDKGERQMFITSVLSMARIRGALEMQDLGADFKLPPAAATRVNWNATLRFAAPWYDRLVEAASMEDWEARTKAIDLWSTELMAMSDEVATLSTAVSILSRSGRGHSIGKIMTLLMLPAVESVFTAEDRRNVERKLMPIAAALALYRVEHGGYPESLDALTPGLLPETPTDLFHHAPFAYRRTGRGYLLYSLGPNGWDDGGSHELNDVFRGYAVRTDTDQEDQTIRALLDTPPEVSAGVDPEVSLDYLIPTGADDHAIRMPPVVFPLPQPAGS
ncbi:hypothetical protein Pla123a_02810 [Posidoniimonas polymericola]|uniref:Bacterial type II secretion system protein G n=1 Tax=Posidoniimonas polymericola TaxID=2528002 RepID=A0A5C5ZDQ4_9BACT|nr:hypothetical protein [Posidoniimonas polymericola]TWT85474.1 hypothetical protein Pla123a_02810 [Posidoniimonas polymericola]